MLLKDIKNKKSKEITDAELDKVIDHAKYTPISNELERKDITVKDDENKNSIDNILDQLDEYKKSRLSLIDKLSPPIGNFNNMGKELTSLLNKLDIIRMNNTSGKYEVLDTKKLNVILNELENSKAIYKDTNGNYQFTISKGVSSSGVGLSNVADSDKFITKIQIDNPISRSVDMNQICQDIINIFSRNKKIDKENMANIDTSVIYKCIINTLNSMNLILNDNDKHYLKIGNVKCCAINEMKVKEGILNIIKSCNILDNFDNESFRKLKQHNLVYIKNHVQNILYNNILSNNQNDFIQFDVSEIHESIIELLKKKQVIYMKNNTYKINTASNTISKKEILDNIFDYFINKKLLTKNNHGSYSTLKQNIESSPISFEKLNDDIINLLISYNFLKSSVQNDTYQATIENNSFHSVNRDFIFGAIVKILVENNVIQYDENEGKYTILNSKNEIQDIHLDAIYQNLIESLRIREVIMESNNTTSNEKTFKLNITYNSTENITKKDLSNKLKKVLINNNVITEKNEQVLTNNYIIESHTINNNNIESIFKVLDHNKIISLDKENPDKIKIIQFFNSKNDISGIIQIILNKLINDNIIDNYKIFYDNEVVMNNRDELSKDNIIDKLLGMGIIAMDKNKNFNIHSNLTREIDDFQNTLINKVMDLSSASLFSAISDWNDNESEMDEAVLDKLLKNGIINIDNLTKKLVSFFQDNSIIDNPIGNNGNYRKTMKGIVLNTKTTFKSFIEYLSNNNIIMKYGNTEKYVSGKTFHSNVLDRTEFNSKFIKALELSEVVVKNDSGDIILNINSDSSRIDIDIYTLFTNLLDIFKDMKIIDVDANKKATYILNDNIKVNKSVLFQIIKQYINEYNLVTLENIDNTKIINSIINSLKEMNIISSTDDNEFSMYLTSLYDINFSAIIWIKELFSFIEKLLGNIEKDKIINLSIDIFLNKNTISSSDLELLKGKKYKIPCQKDEKVYKMNDIYTKFIEQLINNNIMDYDLDKNYKLILEKKEIDVNKFYNTLLNNLVKEEALGLSEDSYYIKIDEEMTIDINTIKKNIFQLLSKEIKHTSSSFNNNLTLAESISKLNETILNEDSIMDVLIKNNFVNVNDSGKYSISNLVKIFTNKNNAISHENITKIGKKKK